MSIPNVLANRYASDEMVAIWSPENKIVAERRLWLAVLRAQSELGVSVPDGVLADCLEFALRGSVFGAVAALGAFAMTMLFRSTVATVGVLFGVVLAGSLLFAMGMQNALVTMVSGSVVRTTHLTGTFTDLGIELAQVLDRKRKDRLILQRKIRLRLVIIFFFLAGALGGAWLFQLLHFHSFFVPAGLLIIALLYDILRIRIKQYYRQLTQGTRTTAE